MDIKELVKLLKDSGVTEITLKFKETNEKKNTEAVPEQKTQIAKPEIEEKKKETEELFKRENPAFRSKEDIANCCNISSQMVDLLLKQSSVPTKKCGRKTFVNVEDLYLYRASYEEDIIKHDGERPGGVKFIAQKLASMVMTPA